MSKRFDFRIRKQLTNAKTADADIDYLSMSEALANTTAEYTVPPLACVRFFKIFPECDRQ